jgi:hypothetical protein
MRPGGVQAKGKLERHGGLPAEVSSLVGRGPQIAAVLDGLRTARVGPIDAQSVMSPEAGPCEQREDLTIG